jgi:hypothetical protein
LSSPHSCWKNGVPTQRGGEIVATFSRLERAAKRGDDLGFAIFD